MPPLSLNGMRLVAHPSTRILLTELTVSNITKVGDDIMKEEPRPEPAVLPPGTLVDVMSTSITIPRMCEVAAIGLVNGDVARLQLRFPQDVLMKITGPLLLATGGGINAPDKG